MKTCGLSPMRSPRRPALRDVALACGALLASVAWAQEIAPAVDVEAPPRTGTWVEPRVSAGVTLTNNGARTGTNPRNDQILEVTPGVTMVLNAPRAKGFVDYSLSALHHVQGTVADEFVNSLNANVTFEAVSQFAYVDVSGVVADRSISAFGTQSFGRTDANRSETGSFRVSPYLRGIWGGAVNYELRYGIEKSNTAIDSRSDITVQDVSLRLRSDLTGQVVGWTFDSSTQDVDYTLGRRTRSDQVQVGLLYAASPQLLLSGQVGVESNNVITLQRESYNTTGLGLDWRPSDRTRLNAQVQKRYFGTGHNVSLEHRTARTVWRFTDTRDVVNNPLSASGAGLGSIYDLFNNLYASIEPDPVRRAQLVQAELLRLGLPTDAALAGGFLSSAPTVDRSQQLSLALVGVRSTVTFLLSRSSSTRLRVAGNLGDDFDANSRIDQQSWSVIYAHRLTPLTSLSASLSRYKSEGTVVGANDRLTALTLGMTTRLALRTSGNLQFMRAIQNGASPYRESAISAFVTHRF